MKYYSFSHQKEATISPRLLIKLKILLGSVHNTEYVVISDKSYRVAIHNQEEVIRLY